MVRERKLKVRVIDIFLLLILLVVLFLVFSVFRQNDFNDFSKAELYAKQSTFKRDSKVKYSDMDSYQIQSDDFNDAMIHKQIEVTPNTPYRVTCMVKTENVVTQQEISTGGALICIADTVEQSKSVTGTQDWQKIEFEFNSKDREMIDVGFRLGGNDDNAKGTVWFSDFTIESGVADQDNTWNMACFIIENIEVTIQENNVAKEVSLQMTSKDIETITQNMKRFQESCENLSNHKVDIEYDVIKIEEPLTSLSYDEENGYYVAPKNVESLIEDSIARKRV